MPSPICQVKVGAGAYQATTFGVDITPGALITIKLADVTDIDSWTILCLSTDELSDKAAINLALVIDNPTKTATFTAPAAFGRTFRFLSRINNGKDKNFIERDEYTTTFALYLPTSTGHRTLAADETLEGNPNFGWIESFNEVIRTPPDGEANTASNVGAGAQVFKEKFGVDLRFRTISNGANITVTQNANDVSIAVPPNVTLSGDLNASNVFASGAVVASGNVSAANVAAATMLTGNIIALGATPATNGAGRLSNGDSIQWRNAANNNNFVGLRLDSSNQLYYGDTSAGWCYWQLSQASSSAKLHVWNGSSFAHQIEFDGNLAYNSVPRIGNNTPYASEGRATQAMADSNQTLGAAIYSRKQIKLTGTHTAARTATVPHPTSEDRSYTKTVENQCTGFNTIISTGTGSTVVMHPKQSLMLDFSPDGVKPSDVESSPFVNGLRLTLSTGVPLPTSDLAGQSTVYLTPDQSGEIAIYDGTRWIRRETAEVSIALSSLTSAKNYDVFARWTGSAVALELSAAWTNDSTRADALTRVNGVLVKSADNTRRYVGTIRTTGTSTTEDSAAKRFVWNKYNQRRRTLRFIQTTDSWAITAASFAGWRAANNGSPDPSFEWVQGENQRAWVQPRCIGTGTAGGWVVGFGVGINSTTDNSAKTFAGLSTTAYLFYDAIYDETPAAGYYKATWLEQAAGGGGPTVTYYGDASLPSIFQAGTMTGWIDG